MGATTAMESTGNLGKFSLYEKMANGCLGEVFRAIDPDLGREVAIRIVRDGIRWDAEVEARLHRECQSVAGLQHPNIAALFGAGTEGSAHYIVTELLGGRDLGSLVAQKSAMTWETRISIMIKVAEGLSHAHKNGVIHRDLKPGKIHLTPDGGVKVRDFGIAHVLMKHLSHPSVRYGVPIYLSPEQVQLRDCDERSDIFSAGIIFYELLTFTHPFHDRNSNKALDNILYKTELPTFDRFPDVPPAVWTILETCLAKDPNDRYPGMENFANACRELLKELADESQLMLAELHAALPRLRKAAAHPGASECTQRLLDAIENLSGRQGETDYASLERLMTSLFEQYPAIQAVACASPEPNLLQAELLPKEAPVVDDAPENLAPSPFVPADSSMSASPAGDPVMPIRLSQPEAGQAAESSIEAAAAISTMPVENSTLESGRGGTRMQAGATGASNEAPNSPTLPQEMPAAEAPSASRSNGEASRPPMATERNPLARAGQQDVNRSSSIYRHRRIPKPTYRTTAALLAILLMATAAFILRGNLISLLSARSNYLQAWTATADEPAVQTSPPQTSDDRPAPGGEDSQMQAGLAGIRILHQEARALLSQNRFDECKVLLRRILEKEPAYEDALATLKEIDALSQAAGPGTEAEDALRKGLARVSALIGSSKLQAARVELDKLQRIRPDAPEILAMRKRLEARNSKLTLELARKEEEQREAARRQKTEEWSLKLAELFAQGKYAEARGAAFLWLSEDPANARAQEAKARLEEIQHGLKVYDSAMAEGRYQDALAALGTVERISPADSNLAELRRRIELKKANARAMLTVYRLGERATLFLDGKPIGNGGEVENESIPIGSHSLSVENGSGRRVAISHEFLEGQRAVYVHDLARQQLRPIAPADREALSRRKTIEEVHRFQVEHSHGWPRGSCKGELLLTFFDVEFKPASGSHGYSLPYKALKVRVEGKSVDFSFASDGKYFQGFKVQDAQVAENFKKIWDNLGNIGR